MKIPAVHQPRRLVGLYVYDFGTWTSVGYTAEEIGVLQASAEHGDGTAYRIRGVTDNGQFELIGVGERMFEGEAIMLFASQDADAALDDFNVLKRAAEESAPPVAIEMELVDIDDLDPPHAVALVYPAHADTAVSGWLLSVGFEGGDIVLGGAEVLGIYRQAKRKHVARWTLAGEAQFATRTAEEVLATVREPVQR